MFDLIKSSRILVGIILALLAIPFAFFGIDFYFRGGDATNRVATVAGSPITGREFTDALRRRQEQLRQATRGQVSQEVLNSPEVRSAVLQQLVNERVVYNAAVKSGMTVTNAELQSVISDIPAFRENGGTGAFSRSLYESALRAQGMNEPMFESLVRRDLVLTRATQSIAATAFVPTAVSDRLYRLRSQEREVSQIVLSPEQFVSKVKLEPSAAKAYYDAHQSEFQLPEKVKVEYVVLSLAGIQQQTKIAPERLQEYFQERRAQLERPEERRASHILITVAADATPEQKAEAKQRAEALLAEARKAPGSFGELAKKHSEDPGSAVDGGDLGFFPRGRMVKAFDDAVFGMKTGDIVGPVETQFGYHIIKLDAIHAAEGPQFEDVRGQIEEELRASEAGRKFAEAAENFSNLVYEQPDSLEPVIDAYKLEPVKSGWITRSGGAEMPLLNNDKFLQALFSDDVMQHGRNTEAVEVAPNVLLSARVIERQPAEQRAFEQMQGEITRKLTQEKAAELAKQSGASLLERLRKGEGATPSWSAGQMVTRERRGDLIPEAAQAVFSADTSKLPAYVGVTAPDGRYVIYRITSVVEVKTVDAEARKLLAQQVEQIAGAEAERARLGGLKEKADVKINQKAIEQPG